MKIATLLAALLLAVPLTAAAQTMLSLEDATKVYNATNRGDREVWMGNPNEAEKVRHWLWILHDHGIYPGNFPRPWAIGIDNDMRETSYCVGCFWAYNEDTGQWEERGGEWHTMRCATPKQIEDERSLAHGAYWMSWVWGGAAATAGFFLRPDLAYWFGLHAMAMSASNHILSDRVARMEANQCVTP